MEKRMKRKSLLAVMSLWLAMTLSACGKQALEEPVVVEQSTVAESKEVQTEQNTGAGETETKEDTPHKTQENESTHQGLKYGSPQRAIRRLQSHHVMQQMYACMPQDL